MTKHEKFACVYSGSIFAIGLAYIVNCWISGKDFMTTNLLLLAFSVIVVYVINDISKLKFSKDGVEFEKIKTNADKVIAKFAKGKAISIEELDALFESVHLNDWSKLILSRMLMRKGLVQLMPDHNNGPSPSLKSLIQLGVERRLLCKDEAADLEKLRNITFYAEWWNGDAPNWDDWNWAITNAKQVVLSVFNKQKISI